jgi:hypothetical protein
MLHHHHAMHPRPPAQPHRVPLQAKAIARQISATEAAAVAATAAASTTTLPTLHFSKCISNRRTLSNRDGVQLLLLLLKIRGIGCRRQVTPTLFPSVSTHYF